MKGGSASAELVNLQLSKQVLTTFKLSRPKVLNIEIIVKFYLIFTILVVNSGTF